MTTTVIASGKSENGYTVRLQQRGKAFDVIYSTGFCWKYRAKAVSESTARNEFALFTLRFNAQ